MTTTQSDIPLPSPRPLSKPFWDGCRRGELLAQHCRPCGKWTPIPHIACMHCLSADLVWERTSGKGTIYSYTVVWRPQMPAFKVPYIIAIVDVNEGYQMTTNIIDCDHNAVRVGIAVQVRFRRMSAEITLPYFRPAD